MAKTTLEFMGIEVDIEYTYSPGSPCTGWDDTPDPEELSIDAVKIGMDDLWKWFESAGWIEELEGMVYLEETGRRFAA